MKLCISFVVAFVTLLTCIKSSDAGAAVQAAKRKQATQGQLQQEKKILQSGARAHVHYPTPKDMNVHIHQPTNQVALNDFWLALNTSSRPWYQIVKPQDKAMVVLHYIDEFKRRGTKIRKSPEYYASMIDSMAQNNPSQFVNPFNRVLQSIAIMEYDFDNGQDKDLLAKQLLGEEGYKANKKRLLNIKRQQE